MSAPTESAGAGPRPVAALRQVRAYRPPDVDAAVSLRLDGTERRSLPPALAERLGRIAAADVSRYPEPRALEARLAARLGVAPGRVVVTAGADEALDRLCRAMLEPGRRLVLATPTFEMLAHYARLAGAAIDEVPWASGPCPVSALAAAVTPATAVVALVTPNNPTGLVATADDLRALSAAAPRALLIVDQAYGEFADVDLTPTVAGLPNAVAVRTLSKAWGLSGLRVGYAVARADVVAWLRAAGGPYSVARPSLALAMARLADDGDVAEYVARVRTERTALVGRLRALGAEPLESQANFVLCRFAAPERVDDALARRGIAVRAFRGAAALQGWRRITCPADAADFERLLAALDAALGGA